jgi:flagellar hook-associated protein 3 FlgL
MLEKLNDTQTSLGGRLNALESQKKSNGDVIFQLEKTHSEVANIDIVGAISRLEFEKINLQAGQQSFVKLQGLSLFNFL